jgi:hypothetical protein
MCFEHYYYDLSPFSVRGKAKYFTVVTKNLDNVI